MTGTSRRQYPSEIRLIRVKCTGRVDVKDIIQAIREGADGVMVIGCHPGECDFGHGSDVAKTHVEFARQVLERIGYGRDRAQMYFCAAAEVDRFVTIVNEMAQKIGKLPPNDLKYE